MIRRIILAILLFTLLVPSSVLAEGGNYIGGQVYRPGDIDGDGRDDVVRSIQGIFIIDFSWNGHPATPPMPADSGTYNLGGYIGFTGDFDGDCLDDLATVSATPPGAQPQAPVTVLRIDYSGNGLNHGPSSGDEQHTYANTPALPDPRQYVVADYDGDLKDDISRLDGNNYVPAAYRIDYAANGFGTWDVILPNYGYNPAYPPYANNGGSILQFRPAGGDFDGDGKADVTVQNANGEWRIDYASNGFGYWDVQFSGGYIGGSAIPYAADFTGEGIADLALRPDDGRWARDNSTNGFGALDQSTTYNFPIWASSQTPGDFDGDGKADLFFISDCWYGGCGWIYNVDYTWNGANPGWDSWSNQGPYLSRLSAYRRAHRFFVRQLYFDLLNRPPDRGGWDGWTNHIAQCATDYACYVQRRKEVARGFFFSPEYMGNNPLLTNPGTPTYNREFVRQCYLGFLRREPDPAGWDGWTNYLNSAGNPTPDAEYTHVLGGFIDSVEYSNRDNARIWIPN